MHHACAHSPPRTRMCMGGPLAGRRSDVHLGGFRCIFATPAQRLARGPTHPSPTFACCPCALPDISTLRQLPRGSWAQQRRATCGGSQQQHRDCGVLSIRDHCPSASGGGTHCGGARSSLSTFSLAHLPDPIHASCGGCACCTGGASACACACTGAGAHPCSCTRI